VCLGFFAFILALLTLEADTREALIYTPLWFIMLGVSYQFVRKSKLQTTNIQLEVSQESQAN
jgi:D-serine/D-alanine/glycine transporter